MKRKIVLAKPKHQYRVPNKENVIIVPDREKIRDYYENPSFSYWMDEL